MNSSYHGIGKQIVVSIKVDELTRRDQVALMADLMRNTGIANALFNDSTLGNRNTSIYTKTIDKYIENKS